MPAARHQDRIEHDRDAPSLALTYPRYQLDRSPPRQHANLHAIGAHIIQDGFHLPLDQERVYREHFVDPLGILNRKRRNGARPIGTERLQCFEVGLQPRSAARIRAGHDQHPRRAFVSVGITPTS
jgi:hypothetical protein